MKQFAYRVLLAYLSAFFICNPVAYAGSKKMAVVEVYSQNPSKNLKYITEELEKKLNESKKVKMIPQQNIAKYFDHASDQPSHLTTKGDQLYADSEKLFLNYELKLSLAVLDEAIQTLKNKPGVLENYFKAYILKAQILLEQKKSAEANKFLEEAVKLNLAKNDLDPYFYAPDMRAIYKKVYLKTIKKTQQTTLEIHVSSNTQDTIYVNGSPRGFGPKIQVKVPVNIEQKISAGSHPHAGVKEIVLKPESLQTSIKVAARLASKSNKSSKNVGLKKTNLSQLVQESVWMGSTLDADQIVLLELVETASISRLTLNVVEPKAGKVTSAKQLDVVNPKVDAETVASFAADHILSLDKSAFKKQEGTDVPVLIGKKKKGMSPAVWAIIGLLVAGAGAGAAMGFGGSSSSGSSTTTATGVNGPIPALP